MSASESQHEPTLFDRLPNEPDVATHAGAAPDAPSPGAAAEPRAKPGAAAEGAAELATATNRAAQAADRETTTAQSAADADPAIPAKPKKSKAKSKATDSAEAAEAAEAKNMGSDESDGEDAIGSDRKRLEQQLHALKRKEAEIRCALVATTHPELADRVREIQGRAYTVSKAEEKLAQGLPKSEARRQEKLDKKLTALLTKRTELDEQIEAVERELAELSTERVAQFESERQQAMEALMATLGAHGAALKAVAVDPRELVPDIDRWWPELEAIARRVTDERAN